MKILLVGNYVNDGQESMQRFAALMKRGLTQAGHDVQIVRPPTLIGRLHASGHGLGKWLGYVDKFAVFPPALRAAVRWADVVHICDHANCFYVKYIKSVPHVVTCHDLLAIRSALGEIPQHQTRWSGRQLQRLILKGLTEARHIVCVSEATRRDLLRITGIPERRVSRAYLSLNYPYSPMAAQEAASRISKFPIDSTQPFFLHVGGNQWYKNRLGVLRIFSALRKLIEGQTFRLIMVGKPWTAEMRRFVVEHGMNNLISELTRVTEEDLRALYSTATMLLFPSFEEGFGWPIIEAQACGCPVATSHGSPMDEVGGNAAVYIDPQDPESAAATVKLSLERVTSIRVSSLMNAARFKGSTMIDSYLSLYDRARNDNAPSHQVN
jgi:glycosyltransferase involved in cell wall biosynthesis